MGYPVRFGADANAMKGDREVCLEVGMNDYLTKPIDLRALADALKRWLPAGEQAVDALGQSEQPEVMSHPSVFDRATLKRRLMDDDELTKTVEYAFLEEIPTLIEALKDGLQEGDAEQVGRHAHSIKGASANVCPEALRDVAHQIETAGREGDLGPALAQMTDLEVQFELVKQEMLPAG